MKAQVNFDSLGGGDVSTTVKEGVTFYIDTYCYKTIYTATSCAHSMLTLNNTWSGDYISFSYGSNETCTFTVLQKCRILSVDMNKNEIVRTYNVGDTITLFVYPTWNAMSNKSSCLIHVIE